MVAAVASLVLLIVSTWRRRRGLAASGNIILYLCFKKLSSISSSRWYLLRQPPLARLFRFRYREGYGCWRDYSITGSLQEAAPARMRQPWTGRQGYKQHDELVQALPECARVPSWHQQRTGAILARRARSCRGVTAVWVAEAGQWGF